MNLVPRCGFCTRTIFSQFTFGVTRPNRTRSVTVYVLLTVHLSIIFVNNQRDAQIFFMYVYFYSLHVSGQPCNASSGELIVLIRHLVYVTLFSVQVWCAGLGETNRVTYTRCSIDTINSPDDEHMGARNM